jgi:hypothetical protein
VAERTTYYAIVSDHASATAPSGLARRTFTPDGRLDETLRHDFTWQRDSAIYEWERGEEMGVELVEISEDQARALIERLRDKWAQQDS